MDPSSDSKPFCNCVPTADSLTTVLATFRRVGFKVRVIVKEALKGARGRVEASWIPRVPPLLAGCRFPSLEASRHVDQPSHDLTIPATLLVLTGSCNVDDPRAHTHKESVVGRASKVNYRTDHSIETTRFTTTTMRLWQSRRTFKHNTSWHERMAALAADQLQVLQAVKADEVDGVCHILQDNTISSETRRLLLEAAIDANAVEVLELLLSAGWAFEDEVEEDEDNESIQRGSMLLNLAVELGRIDCVRILVGYGADVNVPSSLDGMQQTPLHVAAMYNIVGFDLHRLLIRSAADIDPRDLCENTPLHLAAAYGAFPVAKVLVEAGADVNAVNACGSTPLNLAAPNGYEDVVELLIRNGADVNHEDALGNTPLINATFVHQTPIDHFACGDAESQSRVIKLLLNHGVDVNAMNRDGDHAIAGAVRHGYTEAVVSLLDRGACVTKQNRRDESVLHIAARAGVECVELWQRLVDAGADVLARDRYDRTCYGIWVSRPKIVTEPTPETDDQDDDNQQEATSEPIDKVAELLERAMYMATVKS